MSGFWYPYADARDALRHLGPMADHAAGRGAGISFSDGRSIGMVRAPAGTQQAWLNVLARYVSQPKPVAKPQPATRWQRVEHWFDEVMTAYGESQIQEAQANMAASRALAGAVDRNVWQPTHAFLLRHKLLADSLGVAADVVGVIAGGAFIVFALPEVGAIAVVTGVAAAIGSAALLVVDGAVLVAEIRGDEAAQKRIEDNDALQWVRIVATIMTLPDMAVGGVRALKDIPRLSNEAREASQASHIAADAAEAQRARAAKIANPAKHPGPVNKHLGKARRFARAATEQAAKANKAQHELRMTVLRDLPAAYAATPLGAGLMAASPPGTMLSPQQKQRDEKLMQQVAPDGGMPRDVRLEMRISAISHHAK